MCVLDLQTRLDASELLSSDKTYFLCVCVFEKKRKKRTSSETTLLISL